MQLVDYIKKSGENVKPFDGIKKYVATGDIIENRIVSSTDVTYNDKPSRANIKAEIGDILFAKMKNTIKVIMIDDSNCQYIYSTGFYCIEPIIDKVNPKFLYYYLLSDFFNLQKDNYSSGATMKALNDNGLKKIVANFPTLEEQSEIVNKLDNLFSVKNDIINSIEELDLYQKSVFYETFGTPLLNEKSLNILSVEDCCEKVTDGSHFSPKGENRGYPMLSVKDMRKSDFDFSDCKYIDKETFNVLKKQGCVPQQNDLLISKDGSYFAYGFICKEYKDIALLSSIAILRPNMNIVLPEYLRMYLMSDEVVDLVSKNYVTGTALKRVILKGVKRIPVMVPNIELQKDYADKYNKIEIAIKYMEENKKDIADLIESYNSLFFA